MHVFAPIAMFYYQSQCFRVNGRLFALEIRSAIPAKSFAPMPKNSFE
jgi:hypothetical protein